MTTDYRASKRTASNVRQIFSRSSSSGLQPQRAAEQSDWQRGYEHYRNLAENFARTDAVTSEQHWQHAEHFRRLINGTATLPA